MIKKKLLTVVIVAVLIGSGVAIGLSIALWPREEEGGEQLFLPLEEQVIIGKNFSSVWNTSESGTTNDNQVKLPLESGGDYLFLVYWGDGTVDKITRWDQSELTHTYSSPGIYTINITGKIIGWRFNNGGDKEKLIEIKQWGDLRLGNSGRNFYGCANLNITAMDVLNLEGTTTLEQAFRGCSKLDQIPNMNQ